jgi:hypothetical protein
LEPGTSLLKAKNSEPSFREAADEALARFANRSTVEEQSFQLELEQGQRLALHFFLLSMLSSPLLFAIDNLKLNSKLDYTSDSLDGPLITGDDA